MGGRRLFASVHDVSPVHAKRLDRLVPVVEEIVGAGNFALLAVPDFHGAGAINSERAFAARLRGWSDAGCEVFLHGYYHRDISTHAGLVARLKARHLTAGEGEFLGLDYVTARRLLMDGRNRIEDVIGHSVAGFVAPAWLYGPTALQAIKDLEFQLAEDHFRVWHPPSGTIIARGPVVTYASRSRARIASSIAWSRIASFAPKLSRNIRVGVHPHDVDAPALLSEIERALRGFAADHAPSHYSDLLASHLADVGCGIPPSAASDPV